MTKKTFGSIIKHYQKTLYSVTKNGYYTKQKSGTGIISRTGQKQKRPDAREFQTRDA